uniref:Putative transposase n=1 Tax=Pseudomonas putida TaxID=303 RepID=C7T585_PSEPU|nr:putative transposase [Pseudomonas putida]
MALLQRLSAVRGSLSLCADQASACEMVVEHAHGLRQRRGPNAKSSLHKAHLAPDAGLQAPGASLSFAQGSHDFESLDRGIARGDRFETAHRLDQYLQPPPPRTHSALPNRGRALRELAGAGLRGSI